MCVELNDFIYRNYNFVQLAECHFLINKVENDCYESAERWILIFLKNFQFMICCITVLSLSSLSIKLTKCREFTVNEISICPKAS